MERWRQPPALKPGGVAVRDTKPAEASLSHATLFVRAAGPLLYGVEAVYSPISRCDQADYADSFPDGEVQPSVGSDDR